MLDAMLRPFIDPPLDRIGKYLAACGITANAMTMAGLAAGLAAAACIALGQFGPALVLVLLSRLADGLDGAVARASRRTDFGGFLDIIADFAFYAAVPFAFVLHDPAANGVVGAALLAAFYVNGASFFGVALLAEKRQLITDRQGIKNLYYSGGLLEGTETILFFVLLCLWPGWFAWAAAVFALLTVLTTIGRVYVASRVFTAPGAENCIPRERETA